MKASYVIFARDKMHLAEYVEQCVRSAFAQTYRPLEIVLSDQGSTDGTLELLERLAGEYHGPHTVRVLRCPDTERRGMAGMNAHLAWLMREVDSDIVMFSACDDYALPERAARTMAVFEATGADYVGTACWYARPGAPLERRSAFAREGWCSPREIVENLIGGSSSGAWRRELWARVAPVPDLCGCDLWLPPLAAMLGGFWFVNEPLHVYLEHADPRNTGLEGVIRALPEAERAPLDEHRLFQSATAWQFALKRMKSLGVGAEEDRAAMERAAGTLYEAWGDVRTRMTLTRQAPQPFRI